MSMRMSSARAGLVAEDSHSGADEDIPVTEDYQVSFKFTGTIDKVADRERDQY